MNQRDTTHVIDLARSLAEDVMQLHVLSFQMGTNSCPEEGYRDCQRILAEAHALARTIEAMAPHPLAKP